MNECWFKFSLTRCGIDVFSVFPHRTLLPVNGSSLDAPCDVLWFDNPTPKDRLDLWNTVNTVICVAVNNPQNGKI